MTLEEINNERNTLQARLQTLKTQRDAKVLALQQRKEAFSSDRFLGDLYKIDPATASFFADKIAKDRQLDINANKLYSGTYTPEQKQIIDKKEANRQLWQKASATANQALTNKDEIAYEKAKQDILRFEAEDTRLANLLAQLGVSGYNGIGVAGDGGKTDPVDKKTKYEKASDIVTLALGVDKDGFTTKAKKEDAKSKLLSYNATLGAFPLTESELTALNNIIDNAKIPARTLTDEDVIKEVWEQLDNEQKNSYGVSTSLFNAGKENFKNGIYGTAIQNFIKTANPKEAVMSDDVTMADKGQVSPGLQALLKKIGYDSSIANVKIIATNLGKTASEKIKTILAAVFTYKVNDKFLTPEQKKLFLTRYLNSVDPTFNPDTGNNTAAGNTTPPPGTGDDKLTDDERKAKIKAILAARAAKK